MNKAELVEELYWESDLNKRECREMIGLIVDKIAETVAKGENVKLVDFGTFKPSPRKSTTKVHPVTGEHIDVPAKVVPRFSPGKGFNELVEENLEPVEDGSGELEVKLDK
jgi:nucleoid DNA-binding protein